MSPFTQERYFVIIASYDPLSLFAAQEVEIYAVVIDHRLSLWKDWGAEERLLGPQGIHALLPP